MIKSIAIIFLFLSVHWFIDEDSSNWSEDSNVGDALIALGDPAPEHARPNADEETIKRGYELVHFGKTMDLAGKKSSFISKYYACTSCHNQVQEDPDLTKADPESRLEFLTDKGEKFLQGSTFYGIANREEWYGGDYYKKYGQLVEKARNSLAESTQLCAKVCSSGRYLDDWELDAILSYYWTLQLKLSDLGLSENENSQLITALNSDTKDEELIALVKSKYLRTLPVEFGDLPQRLDLGYEYEGNKENGELLYKSSCQSCHQENGVSTTLLGTDKPTMKKFVNNMYKDSYYNLYQIIRKGTYAEKGKPRYMPLYPKEKMSDRQVEDLRAFIESRAYN